MKRLSAVMLTAGIVLLLAGSSFGQGITSSAHDFSTDGWNTSGEVCVVCHTPHNADATASPLWNHEVTATTFTLYSSTSLDATLGQPAGTSKLCLSCHDGTVAVDNFGGATGGTDLVSGSELLGTDLSNDHPVSFPYTTALATADGGLYDPSTQNSGLGGSITADLLAPGDMLECSSCHDVHNGTGVSNLLVKANGGSALCMTCHNK